MEVGLYLQGEVLVRHDAENRPKDIPDALQGRAGGSRTKRRMPTIISHGSQVYRVTIEMAEPPLQSLGMGHVVVRGYRPAFDREAS